MSATTKDAYIRTIGDMSRTRALVVAMTVALLAAACSSGTSDAPESADGPEESTEVVQDGVRLVSAADGAAIQTNPPDGLVVLDVRTSEEFTEGHLEGAMMIDFYADDFADQVAQLDPDTPYILYCRSGNRSGQTAAIMNQLGFTDVAEVDGGILAWSDAGLDIVSE
jgi:phage shock protein E